MRFVSRLDRRDGTERADEIAQRQGIVEAFYDDSVTRRNIQVSSVLRSELMAARRFGSNA
jgi:hypothetical protein